MRKLISRIVETLKLIFGHYPKMKINVDYDEYWLVKRGKNLGLLSDFQRERANIILNHLENNTAIKDIGCGDGAILNYLYKHIKFSKIYGVDVSDIVLEHINKLGFVPIKLDINN